MIRPSDCPPWQPDQGSSPLPNSSRSYTTQRGMIIGRQAPAIESVGELLAPDSWKGERLKGSIAHGECGSACLRGPDGFDTQSLSTINALRHIRQRIAAMP